ncbi:MAG: DEAD/DEAH box helicase [Alphaproteobacteria bacterium]|nr:DEAD/DEAH box helicase [Alphaproteobacteria bacterium]
MSAYAPGARVVIRDEEWMVRRVQRAQGGDALHVLGLSELVRNHEATFLTELDEVEVLAPEGTQLVPDDSPGHRKTRLYVEALLRRSPPTDPRLVIGHRAATRPAPYQWLPAAQALKQPRPRVLMADGVGLGKTIEVGVLLSELIQRGRGQRILVVALKSLLAQLQQELWARFTIPLVRLDSVGIQRVQTKIPSNQNPFHYFDRVIVSIDTLKKDARYRRYLEDCRWDAVVIDECQNVAERGSRRSQRARLAQLLARNTDALILTSATPHDGRPESFASLIRLLEPTAIADETTYTAEDVGEYFVRRFQKDVRAGAVGQFQEREVDTLAPICTPEEEAALQAIYDARFRTIGRSRNTDALFRTLVLKAWLSSPDACVATLEERRKRLGKSKKAAADIQHDLNVIDALLAKARAVPPERQSKLQALFAFLEGLGYGPGRAGQRVVIFSERIATLKMLEAQLARRFGLTRTPSRKGELSDWQKGEIGVFHGGLPDQEQYALVNDFSNANGALRLLLGSDAAAEGLNLHHACHHLVHYDVPWSLITLEQRNGRVDRFGQDHTPILRYLLAQPSAPELKGDLRILERLIEKETEAAKNLGDVAWLMKLHDAAKEEARIARAIEEGEDPAAVLPDVAAPEEDEDDWLQSLLAEPLEEQAEPETTQPMRLFTDDLAFAREAFAELERSGSPARVRWQDELQGFMLTPPSDLALRYQLLPPELRRHDGELRLTVSRDSVMNEIAKARDREDGWPEWELFWEQHPVAEWLNDRVLASFQRHEAPVLVVDRGLAPGEVAYLFQGTVSNARSQPVLVRWMAARRGADGRFSLQPIAEFVGAIVLHDKLPNRGLPPDAEALQAWLPQAVRAFGDQLRRDSKDYAREAALALRPAVKKLRRWRAERLDQLTQRQEALIAARSAQERQLAREREEVEAVYAAREAWIKESVVPGATPYIRLAAAFTGAR